MICIQNQNTDPFFNLAAEEYLLKNFQDDCFMLYQNESSVIIGKHQNAVKEINIDFARKKGIKIARRISGGGTVFHDLGNLNFTFIISGREGQLIDFKRFTMPIVEVLKKMNLFADFDGRNGLVVQGKKFSGNAEHIWKNRTLHHGTLLFSSKLDELKEALRVNLDKYNDKAVKSVPSRVTNIQELLAEKMEMGEFRERIMDHVLETTKDAKRYEFNREDIEGILKLKQEKFITWEWNLGYSPKYNFNKKFDLNLISFEIEFKVEKGIIRECLVKSAKDYLELQKLEDLIINCRHDPEDIGPRISDSNIIKILEGMTLNEFMKELF